MIKFIAEDKEDNRKLVGLGLSLGNINLLKQGNPIKVDGKEMNLDFDIFIFYGRTEEEMQRLFRDEGWITPETKVTIDPRLR